MFIWHFVSSQEFKQASIDCSTKCLHGEFYGIPMDAICHTFKMKHNRAIITYCLKQLLWSVNALAICKACQVYSKVSTLWALHQMWQLVMVETQICMSKYSLMSWVVYARNGDDVTASGRPTRSVLCEWEEEVSLESSACLSRSVLS